MPLPKQSNLRTASGSLKRPDRRIQGSGESSDSQDVNVSVEQLEKLKAVQSKIDEYNNDTIYVIDPKFRDITLTGDYVVVRLFFENLIKFIDESNPEDIQVDAWHRQIDARKRATDMPHWVPTPFPYVQQGVLVAVSPELQLKYLKMQKELTDMGMTTEDAAKTIHMPKVGDIINIRAYESGWFKDHRYYLNKQDQCRDFVRNQEELRLNKFEHYFSLEVYDIESFILNTEKRGQFYEQNETDEQSEQNI